jgi:hypothetical protein
MQQSNCKANISHFIYNACYREKNMPRSIFETCLLIFRVHYNNVNKKLNPIQHVRFARRNTFRVLTLHICIEWIFRARLTPQSWTGLKNFIEWERPIFRCSFLISQVYLKSAYFRAKKFLEQKFYRRSPRYQ